MDPQDWTTETGPSQRTPLSWGLTVARRCAGAQGASDCRGLPSPPCTPGLQPPAALTPARDTAPLPDPNLPGVRGTFRKLETDFLMHLTKAAKTNLQHNPNFCLPSSDLRPPALQLPNGFGRRGVQIHSQTCSAPGHVPADGAEWSAVPL